MKWNAENRIERIGFTLTKVRKHHNLITNRLVDKYSDSLYDRTWELLDLEGRLKIALGDAIADNDRELRIRASMDYDV